MSATVFVVPNGIRSSERVSTGGSITPEAAHDAKFGYSTRSNYLVKIFNMRNTIIDRTIIFSVLLFAWMHAREHQVDLDVNLPITLPDIYN